VSTQEATSKMIATRLESYLECGRRVRPSHGLTFGRIVADHMQDLSRQSSQPIWCLAWHLT